LTLFFTRNLISTLSIALCVAASPVVAQDMPLSETNSALVLQSLGQTLTFPTPDWLTADEQASGAVTPLVEVSYKPEDARAVLEILPKGETEADWNTLYGVNVLADPEKTLVRAREQVVASRSRTCIPSMTAFFQLGPDTGDDIAPLGFVCGGFGSTAAGYVGRGEIMVVAFKKSPAGIAMVFQEWRGPTFDPGTPATWPVPSATVEARARQLQEQTSLSAD